MTRSVHRVRRGVTLSHVAKAAGVSSMTVSRVINDAPNVKQTTRDTVNAVIRELGYAPNLAARSLAKAEAIRIGLLYSNPSAAFLSEFLIGVLDGTQGEGAEVALVRCEDGSDAELAALRRLLDGGATGIVLPPPHSESAFMRRALSDAGVPGAVVGAGRPPEGMICARVNDRQAAADMTNYLLDLGHRRLGLIVGAPNQTSSLERCAGVEAAVAVCPGAWVAYAQGYFDYASGLTAAETLLSAPEPPSAIFALNDDMAAAAVSVAHRRGLNVPNDLTVVGFDDTSPAVTLWPALTTVRQPIRAMAACAVELLLRRLRGQDEGDALDQVLPHTLVKRQSAAGPKAPV